MTESARSFLLKPFAAGVPSAPASWSPEGDGRDRAAIARRALAVRQAVADDGRRRWVVVDENAAAFLGSFIGVLSAGSEAVIPQFTGQDAVAVHRRDGTGLVTTMPELSGLNPLAVSDDVAGEPGTLTPETLTIDPATAVTLFTSGTTGEPKPVLKRFAQLEAEVGVLESLWGNDLGEAGIVATVPHYHLYGLLFRLLWPFAAGRPFPEQALLEPPRIAAACRRFDRAVLVGSPAHLKRWPGYDSLATPDIDLPVIFSSAGPLPEATSLALHRALGPVSVREVYGSSETGGIAWRDQGDPEARDWRVFPGVERDFPQGSPGPMSVRSVVCGGEWMRTGDRAESLPDGFRLLGREDGVVKVEDRRIALAEIEAALDALDWVAESVVLRLDGRRQSTAAALVLTEAGRERLASDGQWGFRERLREALAERFTEVVLPRRFRYLDRLPRNDMGKLRRRDVQALFEAQS